MKKKQTNYLEKATNRFVKELRRKRYRSPNFRTSRQWNI